MKTAVWARWLKLGAILSTSLMVFACVEINGKAEVSDRGQVKVATTYDFSKVFKNIKEQNPALSDRMEGFDCKIFVSTSPNFKCSDEGLLKYKMSDEMDKPVGVTYNEASQELNFDAVKFFAKVTDLKSMVQHNSAQGSLIASDVPALLPLQSARRDMYAKEGLSIVLNIKFANDIVSIDGQEVKNKGRDLTINFMDIADKPSYVIVTRSQKSYAGSKIFIVLVWLLLALAVWFLWRKKNGGTPSGSNSPKSPNGTGAAAVETGSEMDVSVPPVPLAPDAVDKPKMTRGERFSQAISAAAVGMGSAAVGAGASHTVEGMLAQEEAHPSSAVEEVEPVLVPPKDYDETEQA